MDLTEKVIDVQPIYQGKILDLDREVVELPDGKRSFREVIRHSGAVCVLAITSENKMVLVKQWRTAIGGSTLEIPAGRLEPNEAPLKTAVRELNEEIRLIPNKIELVNTYYNSPGYSDEKMYFYYATDLAPVEQELPRDAGEFLEIIEMTLDEAKTAVEKGEIVDGKTILAIYYWELLAK